MATRSKMIRTLVTEAVYRAVAAAAKADGRTISSWLARALSEKLDREKVVK